MKILYINVPRILGLITELKHSNSNVRNWRLTSKAIALFGTHCRCSCPRSVDDLAINPDYDCIDLDYSDF